MPADPLTQYLELTREQEAHDAASRRLAALRAQTLAGMHAAGSSYAQIAEQTGLTRARVQQLVERGRAATRP
jgi:DNA-directed RNA polymerase specialized sigma24 family protein